MKRLLKIWTLVVVMVMGGVLPPQLQLLGDDPFAAQWCAQAKSRNKSLKSKRAGGNKSKKSSRKQQAKKRTKKPSAGVSASPLAAVPAVGKSPVATVRPVAGALLAVGVPKGLPNQVVNYQAIRVNFNPTLRIPNCVAYELTATMVAMADAPDHENRKKYNYARDPGVKSCPENWAYRGSGYSRGHMAPAMDMRWDKTAMTQCFYMTNMCPQDTKLNNDHWRQLEERVHRWAKRDKRLMVYTGPIVGKRPRMIGKKATDIAVPDAFFKVVYAPEQQRAIAFIYENRPCPGGIGKYAVTVAEVERRTGLTFPTAMPKRQCKIEDWDY